MSPHATWFEPEEGTAYEHSPTLDFARAGGPPSQSAKDRGESTERAEEIAARTVNKERARAGESKTASRTSTQDMSSGKRGGQRSHKGSQGPTYDQLYEEAKRRNISGRSDMNKSQLQRALGGK